MHLRRGWWASVLFAAAIGSAEGPAEQRMIKLAKAAVMAEVLGQDSPTTSEGLPSKPVFVTIEVKGVIRGCRGSLKARSTNLEREIVLAARAAASHDPRYKPLRASELKDFNVTVTLVKGQEPITSVDGLRPSDGLVLQSGERFGIVLPWEGKDPKVRLGWAYKKAGVSQGAAVKLFRLKAERFRG